MAIDTAEKRRSVAGIRRRIPGVTPNASKDAEWRQQVGWGYSGIATSSAVIVRPRTCFHLNFLKRTDHYLDFLKRSTHEINFQTRTTYEFEFGCNDDVED